MSHYRRISFIEGITSAVVVASIVSWLGTAIPLVLKGQKGVWAAIKKSIELSNGYEGALFLLVVASVVGSYCTWYATYYTLPLLIPAHLRYTVWFGWVLYLVSMLTSAAVDAPIFIGFSLLADPERLNTSPLPSSQQPSQIH